MQWIVRITEEYYYFFTTYKVLTNILLTRLMLNTKQVVEQCQVAYVQRKSIFNQIRLMKQSMEKSYTLNKDLFLLFINRCTTKLQENLYVSSLEYRKNQFGLVNENPINSKCKINIIKIYQTNSLLKLD